MFELSDSFLSYSSSRQKGLVFKIALLVIILHLGLLAIGTFWNPAPPAPKARSKVIVQTITLKSSSSTIIQNPPIVAAPPLEAPLPEPEPPLPQEELKSELPLIADQLPEESPIKLEEVKKEETPLNFEEPPSLPKEEPPVSKQEMVPLPPPPTLPAQADNPPPSKPSSPKPVQEKKKTAPPKKNIVKKTAEPSKKTAKNEPVKSKTDEAEKKRQQAEAEKKRQQEAEKKRQQEAEKKRQQELAAAQEAARKREQALLNKAKENLAKMGETRDKINTSPSSLSLETTTLPKELGSLQVDALPIGEMGSTGEWGTREISYSDEVASRLKLALRLPDYGAVKIELTLDRNGKVVKVATVQSESKKNKAYVESKVPTLLFPSFGQRFQGKSQNTFVITLQNDS